MTDTNIEFEHIPTSLRMPGVYSEYNAQNAVSTLPTNEQNVLIIAPMVGGDTAYSAPVPIYSDIDAKNAFGAGSWGHLMARIAIQNNPMIRLTAIGLKDNSSGVAATGSLTLNGTATGAGVIKVMIGGVEYAISVAKSETASDLATRLSAVINAGEYCPVTASVSTATLTLTAKCKGEIGNEIELSVQSTAQGISAEARAFASGSQNADLALHLPVWQARIITLSSRRLLMIKMPPHFAIILSLLQVQRRKSLRLGCWVGVARWQPAQPMRAKLMPTVSLVRGTKERLSPMPYLRRLLGR